MSLNESFLRFEKAINDLIQVILQKHGDHDQSTHGSGGRSFESFNDRIEGTQAEADREVERAEKGVQKAKAALKSAEGRQAANQEKVESLTKRLSTTQSKITELKAKSAAASERIAALKAKLKKSREDDLEELEKEIGKLEMIVKRFKDLNGELNKIEQEAVAL